MAQNIIMLGSGFIARFYANSLLGNRSKDKIVCVYSYTLLNAKKFADDYDVDYYTDDLEKAVSYAGGELVCVALPNFIHEKAVMTCVKYKKGVMVTKPLGRNAEESLRMMRAVEGAKIFNGYLEDLVYTPKMLKGLESVRSGALGRILWVKSRETHPGPHSEWFWDVEKAGGGAILDLGCHCIEIGRSYIGKDIKPLKVFCWAETQVKPIDAEDHAIGLIKYENGAIGQFEASWTFRGGMDLRDEVMGAKGTLWINGSLRTGFELFTMNEDKYSAEKAEAKTGWLFPIGDEVHDFGYNNMFQDMLESVEAEKDPKETFYDGYIVNSIIDAAYKSSRTGTWESVALPVWRGKEGIEKGLNLEDYNEQYYLIKKENTHYGVEKVILKDKKTGEIVEKEI